MPGRRSTRKDDLKMHLVVHRMTESEKVEGRFLKSTRHQQQKPLKLYCASAESMNGKIAQKKLCQDSTEMMQSFLGT